MYNNVIPLILTKTFHMDKSISGIIMAADNVLALFLLPVFTFSLTEAVVRYGLDKRYDKKQVFTTSGLLTAAGLLLMLPVIPFIHLIPALAPTAGYSLLLAVYICTSALRALCSQFVRARDMVKLFAADGILATISLFIFNIIFVIIEQ